MRKTSSRTLKTAAGERVLILSAGVGAGHNSAAAAVQQACAASADVAEVQVLDVLQVSSVLYRTLLNKGYFVLVAKPVEGKAGSFAVEATLNEAIVKPVIEETDEIGMPFAVGETGGDIIVRTLPGLWYSLVRGAEVGKVDSVRACVLATGDEVELVDTEKLPDAAFYRVRVTVSEQKIDGAVTVPEN